MLTLMTHSLSFSTSVTRPNRQPQRDMYQRAGYRTTGVCPKPSRRRHEMPETKMLCCVVRSLLQSASLLITMTRTELD
uniref:Uncharacterized protein n=1 Tax=Knipowitschia caucasica TaxID=637954 RepID=A0AAV2M7K0_KNICA